MANTIRAKKAVTLALVLLSAATLLIVFAAMTLRSGRPLALATLPTPTPTNTPVPPGVIDFSAGILTSPTNAGPCDSSGVPTLHCDIQQGSTFVVGVYLKALPSDLPGGDYSGYDVRLDYSGVTSAETNASLDLHQWPNCVKAADFFQPSEISAGCAVGVNGPESTYTGRIMTAELTCTNSGSITLLGGVGITDIANGSGETHYAELDGSEESITINCVSPAAYPIDTDLDRCPDANELGMNPAMGGQRNFLNSWDYFNPTLDGQNRVDDILRVLGQYFIDQGSPDYWAGTDRTLVGPNLWNLGPPDGQQRIDDVLNSVHQYFNDCS